MRGADREEDLRRAVGHEFRDPGLLREALTHRSADGRANERLEFLGDALLGFVVADLLYHRFPTADEGQLTRLRARLVSEDSLAAVARDLELGRWLRLGAGETKSGGADRASILADALEALIGALWLDGGMEPCRAFITRAFRSVLETAGLDAPKDPKTELQEWLQKQGLPPPVYRTVEVQGEPHRRSFVVECHVPAFALAVRGTGAGRKRAEQAAAGEALLALRRHTRP